VKAAVAPVVAVYRSELVRRGEPFVLEQPAAMRRYRPLIIGAHRLPGGTGIPLPKDAYVVAEQRPFGSAWATSLKLAGYAPPLRTHLARAGTAILHAHFGPEGVRCLRIARRLGVPLVTTYHGFDVTRRDENLRRGPWGERMYVRLRDRLARQGALHIAVSDYLRHALIERGLPENRVVRHYLGVNTQFFVPPTEPRARDLVVVLGRIDAGKGCLDAVEAVALVSRDRPCRIVFVGDGPEREAVERAARVHGVNITITGFEERGEVRSWLQRATVLLGPSRTVNGEQEAFGLAYAEANATGLPVVGYASGGVREAVEDGVSGVLCREGDVTGLARATSMLFANDECRARMGAAGVRRVCERFDLERQARSLEDLYDAVRRGEAR
jgi:colanic acid/amylovoran biosynthesis glycosyltransferase